MSSISELLKDVEVQKEERSVIIDADSICFTSCYKFRESRSVEDSYIDFWQKIKTIEIEIWKAYKVGDVIISLTSRTNFRDKLTEKWKADRVKDESEMNEKQLGANKKAEMLKEDVKELKKLLYKRMN